MSRKSVNIFQTSFAHFFFLFFFFNFIFVSISYVGNSHNISNFHYIIFVKVISDLMLQI